MKSQSNAYTNRVCKYDPPRAAKSFTMLIAFIFGHLLPVTAYAVETQITLPKGIKGTSIQQNGNVYDVTTTQFHNAAGVNHFDKYNVGSGDLVNMRIPTDKSSLVNFIHGGRSDINGIVNAMKNGKIGGDIYFANRDGVVIGRSGVINAGSIHLSTPTQEFMNNALNGSSANVDLLLNNTFPISSSGLIQVEGKLNATVKASIRAGKVILSGAEINSGEAARKDIKINYGDIVNVEKMETAQSIGVDENGVIELFGTNGVQIKENSKVVAQGKENGGKIAIKSDADVVIEDSVLEVNASESGKAGDITVNAKTNINLEEGAVLSAAGSGANSDGGDIVVLADEETRFEAGAKVIVDAGESGDAGFGEISAVKSVFLNGGEFSGKALNGESGQFLIDPEELLINTDMINADGSTITLEASDSVTIENALILSGKFSSGDVNSIKNGTAYSLEAGVGSITITAPVISVKDATLVSGGDIKLDANYSNDLLQALASISPLQIPNLVSKVTLDNAVLSGTNVEVEAGISWGGLTFGEDSEVPDDFDWSSIDKYLAEHTKSFISELFTLPINIAVVDLDSSITVKNNTRISAVDQLSLASTSELELELEAGNVSNLAFALVVGVVDNNSKVTIDNSQLSSSGGEIGLSSKVSTSFSGSAASATSAGEQGSALLGAMGIVVTDIESQSSIDIDSNSTGSVISAGGDISIESVVAVETEVSVEVESGAGGPMGIGVLVNNETANSTLNLAGEYKAGDGADLIISSLIDSNHSADNAVSVATAKFEEEDDASSSVQAFSEDGLSGMLRGFLGDKLLDDAQGTDGKAKETEFAFTGGVNVINLTRDGQVNFDGKVSSQTGADINDVSIASVLSSYDDDEMETGVGLQASVTSDADAKGEGEDEGSVSIAVAFQTLNITDDIDVIIGQNAELSVSSANLDLESRVQYTDPTEKFFEQSKETVATIESYFDDPTNLGDDLGEFFISDDGLKSVIGLYFDSQEFKDKKTSEQAAAVQEFVFDYIQDEIKSGFTTHVAGTAKGAEKLGLAASISLFDTDSKANVAVDGLNFLGNTNSATINTENTARFNHSVMPMMTQIFDLLKTEYGGFKEALTAAPSGGVGFSWLNESYDLASKVDITRNQLDSSNLEIKSNQTTDLLKIVATGGNAAKLGIAGSVINQSYTTDTGASIQGLVNGDIDVKTVDHLDDFSLAGAVVYGGNSIGASVVVQDIERSALSEYKPATAGVAATLNEVSLDTAANGDQNSIAIAGAVSTKTGSKIALAASFSHIDTANKVVSSLGNVTAENLTSASLAATDSTSYTQFAGALGLNLTGTAGFGGASSSGVFNNKIESSINNTDFGKVAGAGDSVILAARDYTTNSQYSFAAAAGKTVGISGAVNILTIGSGDENESAVVTSIDNSTITGFNTISLDALDQDKDGGVKETKFVTGGLALGGKVGIGASVATYNAKKIIKSSISNSSFDLDTSLTSNASRNEDVNSVVVAGGVGGAAGIAGAVSVYNAGSTVASTIQGSDITAGSLTLGSTNKSVIDVVNVAVGVGGTAGIAGSVVVNTLGDTTKSEMTGTGELVITGNVDITAELNQTTEFEVAAAGVGGKVGVAGSVVINTINNNTSVVVGSGYKITNASNVSLEALSDYTREGFVGAIAGGTVGVGAVVTVDDIQNTTNAVLAANTVSISGQVDVQANSINDYDLLALNISGGAVAVGATVNIVNFGGDISSATGELKGDNLDEYNTVVAEYNISADTGKTSAAIESGTITAASINLVAKQANILNLESGGLAIGGAAIGVGVGVIDVKSEVESRIANDGVYTLTGSAGLNVSSLVDTAAEVSSMAGSVGGLAINVRVSDYSSTASATTSIGNHTQIDLQNNGKVNVGAKVLESSLVENISVSVGTVAASGALVKTTHSAKSLVEIGDGAEVINAKDAVINSEIAFTSLKANAVGLSVGVAAGGLLFTEVNIEDSQAKINTGNGSSISGESVTIGSKLSTGTIISDITTVAVGLGALSLSDSYVKIGDSTEASMNLGGNISATGDLKINSEYKNINNLIAQAQGAAGGIVGVSAAQATITNSGSSSITLGSGADLSGDSVTIKSSAKLQQEASAKVLAGGAVGIGGVLSTIYSQGKSHVTLGGKIKGRTVDIDSYASDLSVIDNSSGAGGVGALTAGGVYNTNIMEATITTAGMLSIDTLSFDVASLDVPSLYLTAETSADFDARLKMSSYGLLAGAAGEVVNTITQNSTVDLSSGVKYLNDAASTASINALNKTLKNEAKGNSYQNTLAGLRGYSVGSSSTTHTSDADIIMGAFESADNVDLTLKAYNDTDITDTVKFDSYLLAGGSDSKSSINSTNNTKIEFLAGDSYVDSLKADAYSNVDLTSEVRAVVSGLIAVDVTSFNTALSQGSDSIIFNSGVKLLANDGAELSAGTAGNVTISNKSYSYNKSLLPVIPDAGVLSSGSRNGSISIASGAEIRAGGDITISASHNELDVSGYALGHSITLEVLDAFVQGSVGWVLDALGLPSSVKYEDEMRSALVNNGSSVTIDGTIQSGLYNYYYAIFDETSGNTLETIKSSSLPGDIDPDSEYIKKLDYSVLADGYQASREARESLNELELFIEVFETRDYGNDDGDGTYQQTYIALLQQKEFLENILANGLSDNEFSQIRIKNEYAKNGNIYINADKVSGEGNITVIEEAKVFIENHSRNAVRVGDIVMDFKGGGKVFFNDTRQQGSVGTVSIASQTLANTHKQATLTPGISILGNTLLTPSPPIILDGRISYAGQNINITNQKGSVIGTKKMEITGSNVRIAAGKDIILGLDNQNVIAPIIVDQNQTSALLDLLGTGTATAALNISPAEITTLKLNTLLNNYKTRVNGEKTTTSTDVSGSPAENMQTVKSLLKLLTDTTWTETMGNYSVELAELTLEYNAMQVAIENSSEHFKAITNFEVRETNLEKVLQGVYNHVVGQTQPGTTDAGTNADILAKINAITNYSDLDKWYTRTAIEEGQGQAKKTVGYTFTIKNNGELSACIATANEPIDALERINDEHTDVLATYNENINFFKEEVIKVFANREADTIVSTTTKETIKLNEILSSKNAIVAGESVFLSASAVNLNGHIQAGFDTREIVIDDALLTKLKTVSVGDRAPGLLPTYTTAITADVSGSKLVYNKLVQQVGGSDTKEEDFVVDGVNVMWNAADERIEVGAVEIKGGNITIAGQLFNTGEGNINVMSGYGKVIIDNQTDAEIEVGDIVNNYISGKVTLIDTSHSLYEEGTLLVDQVIKLKKTEYYRELDLQNNVQLVKDVFMKTGSDGKFEKIELESSKTADARSSIYNPKTDLVYTYQKLNLNEDETEVYQDATTIVIGGNTVSIAYDFGAILSVDKERSDEIGLSSIAGEYNVLTYDNEGTVYLDASVDYRLVDVNSVVTTYDKRNEYFYGFDSSYGAKETYYTSPAVVTQKEITTKLFDSNTNDFDLLRTYITTKGLLTTNDVHGVIDGPRVNDPDGYYKTVTTFVDTEYWRYHATRNSQNISTNGIQIDFNHREAVMRASNPVNINFMGYDRGEVTVKSGGNVIIGNISNSVGDTVINSTKGSVEQRNASTIHSDDISITAENVGTATRLVNIYQDTPDHQELSVVATGNIHLQSMDGALEFNSLSNGANSELVLIAEGDLRVKNHREANQLAAKNIYLESKSGELFSSEDIYTDIKSENGGVIIAKSDVGDIKLIETAGDLAVEKIKATGDVEITVRNGGLTDAQPVEERDEATILELLALWDELGIVEGTAKAQERVDSQYEQIQKQKKTEYSEHWEQRKVVTVTHKATLGEDFEYSLSAEEKDFFAGKANVKVSVNGQEITIAENLRLEKQARYDLGYSIKGAAYDADFVATSEADTKAYHFYWNLDGNKATQTSFAAYDENYVYQLSETEVAHFSDKEVELKQARIDAKTASYSAGAALITGDKSTASYDAQYVFVDDALKTDIENKMTWSKEELTSVALNFAYKETTDTVTEVEKANILSGGDVKIKANFVGIDESEFVIVETDATGAVTTDELHVEAVVTDEKGNDVVDADGNVVTVTQATEQAKLALLSAERNGILIDYGQEGKNAKLSILQQEDFDIDAVGEVSIDTTGNTNDLNEHVYVGSEQDITVKQIASSGSVTVKSAQNIIAAENQANSHILYGDALVLEAANGYIGGEFTTTGNFLKIETNKASISATDKVGLSARAAGAILIQNATNQDLWIRDIFSRNGTVAIDASGSILDRDNLDYGGASDSINIGASRVELTSHNGSVGDQSTYGQIELNGDTVLVASAAKGVFIDGDGELYVEDVASSQGDITITVNDALNVNKLTTTQGDITLDADTVKTYTEDPNYTEGDVTPAMTLAEAQLTTSAENEVIITALGEDATGPSVDLALAAQQGVFDITAFDKVVIDSSAANPLNISSILSEMGAITITANGELNINSVKTTQGDIKLQASTVKTYTEDLVNSATPLAEAEITTSATNEVIVTALGADATATSVDLDLAAQQGVFEVTAPDKVVIESSAANPLNISTILSDKGAITITANGELNINQLTTTDGNITLQGGTVKTYTKDLVNSGMPLAEAQITTSAANEVIIKALAADATGISVDLDLAAQQGVFEVAALDKVVIESSTANPLNISTILSDMGAVDITQMGDVNIGTVGTPTELHIKSIVGDIDIDTIGGDFTLSQGQVHTPQSISLWACADDSSISIENFHVAKELAIQADSIRIGNIQSKDHSEILMSISGNDGGRTKYLELNATNNTPLRFTQLYSEGFAITTDNDLVTIVDGNIGNRGTIKSNRYNIEVSSSFQPLGIYDYQLNAATNNFELSLIGPNLYTSNYATYVRPKYIINAEYRNDESALSLMEKLNALGEQDMYYQIEQLFEELDQKKKKDNQNRKLFKSHLESKNLSKL